MNRLPVPPLDQTFERYLRTVRPLLDDAAFRRTTEVATTWFAETGPAAQAALERYADESHDGGTNWLWDPWLDLYYTGRAPLPLTFNVGFQIHWDSAASGIERAADIVHGLAAVHLQFLRGETQPDVSPRGSVLCDLQWPFLAGGIRHPGAVRDEFRPGPAGASHREVVVLWRGQMVALRISDDQGRPLGRPGIAAALRTIVALPPQSEADVTRISYLDSARAAGHLDRLLADAGNRANYDRLTDALFVINLTDEAAEVTDHLRRTLLAPGQAWAGKPVSLQVSLADRFAAVHVEHSTVDGAVIREYVARARRVASIDTGEEPTPEPLTWTVSPAQATDIARDTAAYNRLAEPHRVRIVTVPAVRQADVGFRLSQDAVQQFAMLYAQLRTYGRLRSTYESVEMREYTAGRTECLRPNTEQAVALAQALLAGAATSAELHAALDAHRAQVKACKAGQAIDRHLFGLSLMARRLGLSTALFDDAGYRTLTTDFLSTTSVGDAEYIVRYVFAPTVPGGIGVNYTPTDGQHEFCLIFDESRVERLDDFVAALVEGSDLLRAVISAG